MPFNTGREYKPGLLVAEATVKGYDKPWSILIDSEASSNYVRRCSLERSPRYVEALEAPTMLREYSTPLWGCSK